MIETFNELRQQLYEKFKPSVVDHIIQYYSNSIFFDRDMFFSQLIYENIDSNVSNILIVGGNVPLVYLDKFKNYNLTFIDNNTTLYSISNYIKEKYNCDVINKNPITEDLQSLVDHSDIIIYPETETLLPFDYLKYKHKNKKIYCSNCFYYDFKLNDNLAYSEDDLAYICNINNIVLKGSQTLPFPRGNGEFYYVIGNAI